MKKRLFVDMDGTLAVWRNITYTAHNEEEIDASIFQQRLDEVIYSPRYFFNLPQYENVVGAIRQIVTDTNTDIEVFISTCVVEDKGNVSPRLDKNKWLCAYLPEIDDEHRIFVPNGKNKADYVPGGIKPGDFLLDDYTKNLLEWELSCDGSIGIKMLNDVNSSSRTWTGSSVSYNDTPEQIKNSIIKIILRNEKVIGEYPPKNEEPVFYKDFLKENNEKE